MPRFELHQALFITQAYLRRLHPLEREPLSHLICEDQTFWACLGRVVALDMCYSVDDDDDDDCDSRLRTLYDDTIVSDVSCPDGQHEHAPQRTLIETEHAMP